MSESPATARIGSLCRIRVEERKSSQLMMMQRRGSHPSMGGSRLAAASLVGMLCGSQRVYECDLTDLFSQGVVPGDVVFQSSILFQLQNR